MSVQKSGEEAIVPQSDHNWSGWIVSVSMEDSVLVGSSQTVSITTERESPFLHESSSDFCRTGIIFGGGIRIGVRVLIDGDQVAEDTRCTTDPSGSFSDISRDTFDLAHSHPTDPGNYDYTIQLFSPSTGDVADSFETIISVGEGQTGDFSIQDVSPKTPTAKPGELVEMDVTITNEGSVEDSGELETSYKGEVVDFATGISLGPGESITLTRVFEAGQEEGSFPYEVRVNGSVSVGNVEVSEHAGESCGFLDTFTEKRCCPAQFSINSRFIDIDPPNVCAIIAGGVALGITILLVGGRVVAVPWTVARVILKAAGGVVGGARDHPRATGTLATVGLLLVVSDFF